MTQASSGMLFSTAPEMSDVDLDSVHVMNKYFWNGIRLAHAVNDISANTKLISKKIMSSVLIAISTGFKDWIRLCPGEFIGLWQRRVNFTSMIHT